MPDTVQALTPEQIQLIRESCITYQTTDLVLIIHPNATLCHTREVAAPSAPDNFRQLLSEPPPKMDVGFSIAVVRFEHTPDAPPGMLQSTYYRYRIDAPIH